MVAVRKLLAGGIVDLGVASRRTALNTFNKKAHMLEC